MSSGLIFIIVWALNASILDWYVARLYPKIGLRYDWRCFVVSVFLWPAVYVVFAVKMIKFYGTIWLFRRRFKKLSRKVLRMRNLPDPTLDDMLEMENIIAEMKRLQDEYSALGRSYFNRE